MFCLFVLGLRLGLDVNYEVHSLPLPDDCNHICRVPQGPELPLCLYRIILGAGTDVSIVILLY